MSGGHFDYQQYKIDEIANEIENMIQRSRNNDWCEKYSEHTLSEFQCAITHLRIAAIYAQRIDWLLSGDDGEQTFHQRLQEELKTITPLIV